MSLPILDITKIRTIKDLNQTNFNIRVKRPINEKELKRICKLSEKRGAKILFDWSEKKISYNTEGDIINFAIPITSMLKHKKEK